MRCALFLLSLLPCVAVPFIPASAAPRDPVTEVGAPLWRPHVRLAQRQPGGLPGMSEGEEEGRPGAKGVPGRSRQADPPSTRSLQTPKSPGRSQEAPAAAEKSDKKAPKGQKKTPDGGS